MIDNNFHNAMHGSSKPASTQNWEKKMHLELML